MSKTDEEMATIAKTMPKAEVLGGVVPYLSVDGAAKAADFYTKAFGAKEVSRFPLDEKGRTMHIHLHINGGSLMLSDFFAEYGYPPVPHQGFTVTLPVRDIQFWWDRAVAAGATVKMPLSDMFWGDRYGQLVDPFGVMWAMNEPLAK
jgi:PhnB protein